MRLGRNLLKVEIKRLTVYLKVLATECWSADSEISPLILSPPNQRPQGKKMHLGCIVNVCDSLGSILFTYINYSISNTPEYMLLLDWCEKVLERYFFNDRDWFFILKHC